jgi:putative ABC transport system permease protein
MLVLKNISKKYDSSKKEVLSSINISFNKIGLVSILGPSGSGKSTLLNIIGLIDKPTKGSIILNGKDITKLKSSEIDNYHHNYIGFIFQNYNLINSMNVIDNINLLSNHDIDNTLKKLNILKYKNTPVNKLSGGEQQRVAIARALANKPNILLCDEPTGALDEHNKIIIMKLLKKLSRKMLVIMVTHDELLATTYSDRIINIKDGKIISDTNPKVIEDNNKYEYNKFKIKINKIIKIVFNNLKIKLKRNILIVLAFTIGLLSLSMVLGISNGFKTSLEKEEKESLSEYPIYISPTSTDALEELNNTFNEKDNDNKYIYSIEYNITNTIDDNLIELINNINSKYKIINYYTEDYKTITYVDNNYLNEVEILSGTNKLKENEVLIMLDSNNEINKEYLEQFNLIENKYTIEELLNKYVIINNKKYQIVGIVKNKKDTVFSDNMGIIANITNCNPISITIYPKDYQNKMDIINILKSETNIKFTDYADSIVKISTTIMNGISTLLIIFSLISLIVSTIMISIITIISIMERKREIGIYKSMGTSNIYIKKMFILESIIIGLISSIISIILEVILSIPINTIINNITGLSNVMNLSISNIFVIILLGIIFSIIGTIPPLNRINKIEIVDILRNV